MKLYTDEFGTYINVDPIEVKEGRYPKEKEITIKVNKEKLAITREITELKRKLISLKRKLEYLNERSK